jgi:hypothetical protein
VLTISRIFTGHLALTKLSRRCAHHDLTEDQKQRRCHISERFLNVLPNDESAGLSQVAMGYEFWFSCHYQSTYCCVKFRAAVPPRTKSTIFTETELRALGTIPHSKTFDQNYFLVILIPESSRRNMNASRAGLTTGVLSILRWWEYPQQHSEKCHL